MAGGFVLPPLIQAASYVNRGFLRGLKFGTAVLLLDGPEGRRRRRSLSGAGPERPLRRRARFYPRRRDAIALESCSRWWPFWWPDLSRSHPARRSADRVKC